MTCQIVQCWENEVGEQRALRFHGIWQTGYVRHQNSRTGRNQI